MAALSGAASGNAAVPGDVEQLACSWVLPRMCCPCTATRTSGVDRETCLTGGRNELTCAGSPHAHAAAGLGKKISARRNHRRRADAYPKRCNGSLSATASSSALARFESSSSFKSSSSRRRARSPRPRPLLCRSRPYPSVYFSIGCICISAYANAQGWTYGCARAHDDLR